MDEELFPRTFTRDELVCLAKAARFTRRALKRAGYPDAETDKLALVYLRVVGVDLPIEGLTA